MGALIGLMLVALPAQAAAPAPERVKAALASEGELAIDGRRLDRNSLRRYYEARRHEAAWQGSRSTLDRARFIATLAAAPAHGLDPADYHLPAITARQSGDTDAGLELELLLSDAFFRYATHMRVGRVNMAAIERDWDMPPTPFDAVGALAAIGDQRAFRELLAALPPQMPEYKRLMQALAEWQGRLSGPAWPMVTPGRAIKPNMIDQRLVAVRQRLIAEGDLAADKAEGETLDVELTAALKKFQLRYGLEADGVVGARTVLTMNISPATRVEQILANLERHRAMPRDIPSPAIIVNVAGAYADLIENSQVAFSARVIVGTPANRTPVLASSFQSLTWNPPWTVPYSIASRELLPKLKRDPGYLARNNMIILGREDDPQGQQLNWADYGSGNFPFVLRQLPGVRTALGHVVFEMPNKFGVFLHDTPDRQLFERGDRFFSHGCVRLENPRVLAAMLLRDNPQWTPEAIDAFIDTGATQRVVLSRSVPIYLTYRTVYLREGELHFRHDIYGRDGRLMRALDSLHPRPLLEDSAIRSAAAGNPTTGCELPRKKSGG